MWKFQTDPLPVDWPRGTALYQSRGLFNRQHNDVALVAVHADRYLYVGAGWNIMGNLEFRDSKPGVAGGGASPHCAGRVPTGPDADRIRQRRRGIGREEAVAHVTFEWSEPRSQN